jgi:chorismate synthase
MGSTFGRFFRITTFGESHGGGVGVVIDGCPPRLDISLDEINAQLVRRKPGQSRLTTQRRESDEPEILSGIFNGQTLGTPICLLVKNRDARSTDYEDFKDKYRPSHADYTYDAKYGIRNWMGGGRASARETIGRVAGGAVAEKLLKTQHNVEIVAWVESVQDIKSNVDPLSVTRDMVDSNIVRCPDQVAADKMVDLIDKVKSDGDSIGGVVSAVARNVPAGWGEPVFNKLESDLAAAMMSLPASKGFEVGSGFSGTLMRGSEHNDLFHVEEGKIRTKTNYSGGIQGGISNGEPIFLRVAFKPVATIFKEQQTVDNKGNEATLVPRGRHDPCVLPRAVPIVEAMMALTLADHYLAQKAQTL